MENMHDFLITLRAIEELSKGLDITCKVPDGDTSKFVMTLDEPLQKYLAQYSKFIIRDGKKYSVDWKDEYKVNLHITEDVFQKAVQTLYQQGYSTFPDFSLKYKDVDAIKKLEEQRKSWDYTALENIKDLDIVKKLTIDKCNTYFKVITALADYPTSVASKMYEAYKTPLDTFMIDSLKDFKVVDNRIIIPLADFDRDEMLDYFKEVGESNTDVVNKVKCIVISKNPYDYYYASYGSEVQSCFSLNSDYKYFWGYMPFSVAPESFIIYASDGGVNDTAVISGKKFKSPRMFWRSWGYLSDDNRLIVDKKYRLSGRKDRDRMIEFLCHFLRDRYNCITDDRSDKKERNLYKKGKGILEMARERFRFYNDSLILTARKVTFLYSESSATSIFKPEIKPKWDAYYDSFYHYAQTVKDYEDIDLSLETRVVDGKLMNIKKCPVTGLTISVSEESSPYAKYFTKPAEKSLLITSFDDVLYVSSEFNYDSESICIGGGYESKLRPDRLYLRSDYAIKNISLKSLKEYLKSLSNASKLQVSIILRVVQGDKVNVVIYK